jgi:hypothetical protein
MRYAGTKIDAHDAATTQKERRNGLTANRSL